VFRTERAEVIVGGEVVRGRVRLGVFVRFLQGGKVVGGGEVVSVQKEKVEVAELVEGETGGLAVRTERKVVIGVGDRAEFFVRKVRRRKL
jgi:translation initiation factor IF-2